MRAVQTNDWQLAGLGRTRTRPGEISGVTRPFSGTSFNDVGPLNTNTPAGRTVLTVETFDGFTYVAHIGAKENNVYPVSLTISASLAGERERLARTKRRKTRLNWTRNSRRSKRRWRTSSPREECEPWVYQVPAYGLDEVLKPRAELLLAQTNTVAGKYDSNPKIQNSRELQVSNINPSNVIFRPVSLVMQYSPAPAGPEGLAPSAEFFTQALATRSPPRRPAADTPPPRRTAVARAFPAGINPDERGAAGRRRIHSPA